MDYDTQPVAADQDRRTFQREFLTSFKGIIKIFQIVLSILTFALSTSSSKFGYQGGGWVGFVSMTGFLNATIWFILYLFNTVPDLALNYFVELIVYSVLTLFFFIAGIVAACKGYIGGVVAAASFFAFACFVAFGIDMAFQAMDERRRWKARNDRRVPTSPESNISGGAEVDIFIRPQQF
jgi:hypothetical protein